MLELQNESEYCSFGGTFAVKQPSIRIALLEADKIYNTFGEAMQAQKWPEKMPTKAVLISGPSKTAVIELILAFGVHGPKELIALILS